MTSNLTTTAGDALVTTAGDNLTHTAVPVTYINDGKLAGVNLEELRYWQRAIPFVNILKAGTDIVSSTVGGSFDDGRAMTLNTDGYPTSLLADQAITYLFMADQSQNYPGGTYTLKFDGDSGWNGSTNANIDITAFGTVTSESDGEIEIDWTPVDSNQYIRIVGVNGADPIVNMRLLLPGYADEAETFYPPFVADLKNNFSGLRFMKWQNIKDSVVTSTADATPVTHVTYGMPDETIQPGGCPLAIMVQLCNETECDMWYCFPHGGDDALATADATYIQANLDTNLKVRVEYSNETWNGAHEQKTYCDTQSDVNNRNLWYVPSAGDTDGPDGNKFRGNRRFHSERSQELFDLFAAQISDSANRMVRVLGGWNASPSNNRIVMDWAHTTTGIQAKDNADVLATAPYFGSPLTTEPQAVTGPPDSPYTEVTVDMTAEEVVAHAADDSSSTELWTDRTKTNIDDAAARGLGCEAYESGQHLAGSTGTLRSNAALTALFTAANQHDDMRPTYKADLLQFQNGGGGMNHLFQYTTRPGQGAGNWGLKEYQSHTTGPKWLGFLDWASPSEAIAEVLREDWGAAQGTSVPLRQGKRTMYRITGIDQNTTITGLTAAPNARWIAVYPATYAGVGVISAGVVKIVAEPASDGEPALDTSPVLDSPQDAVRNANLAEANPQAGFSTIVPTRFGLEISSFLATNNESVDLLVEIQY